MSEVKKWYIGEFGGEAQARPCSPAEFEIIHASEGRYFVLAENYDSAVQCFLTAAEGCVAAERRERALQQRLTAADERADVLEGALRTSLLAMKRIYQAGYDRIIEAGGTCDTPEYMMAHDPTTRELRGLLVAKPETVAGHHPACRAVDDYKPGECSHSCKPAAKLQGEPAALHPDAIIEGVMTSAGISHAIYASTVSLKHGEQVKLYAEQPVQFQSRVQPWMTACFGEAIAADRQERNHRFLEEALELVQANQCTASEAHQLVDYVYGRPVGEPSQEVGGVMVTLAALCLALGLDMHVAAETELARIWNKVEQIRAKQATKPAMSPLPGAYPDREQTAPVAVVLDERSPQDYAIEHAEYMAKSADDVLAKFQEYGLALLAVDESGDDGEGELFENIDSTRSDLQEALVDLRGMVYEFRKRAAKSR